MEFAGDNLRSSGSELPLQSNLNQQCRDWAELNAITIRPATAKSSQT
jgi:hypothetical protein